MMDRVFAALAHEARRRLLDALYARNGQTLSELCSLLAMSRQAASKHVAILEEAGLVVSRREGREKLHYLDQGPIQAISERWIRKFEESRLMALSALKGALEEGEKNMSKEGFVYQVVIASTAEKVFRALTNGEFTRQYWFGRSIASDWKIGSAVTVTKPDGGIEVNGKVLEYAEFHRLSYTWGTENPDTDDTVVLFQIVEMGALVKLIVTHDIDLSKPAAEQAVNGWTLILNGIKTLLETGKPLPLMPMRR